MLDHAIIFSLPFLMLSKSLQTPEFISNTSRKGCWAKMPVREHYNKILRDAFEGTLDILGESGKRALIQELEQYGAYSIHNDSYLSLWNIGKGLKELFNEEIAELVMEGVMIRMDKLYSLQQVNR